EPGGMRELHWHATAAEWAFVDKSRARTTVLGLLPALGSAAYKGVPLSTNAQPGWRDARWLGGYLTNSALPLGCAELLALAALMLGAGVCIVLGSLVLRFLIVRVPHASP